MTQLPANKRLGQRDALYMIQITGIEQITKALRMGDAFDLDALSPMVNRYRALVAAYDFRMDEMTADERATEAGK